jgi:hypothetical protein
VKTWKQTLVEFAAAYLIAGIIFAVSYLIGQALGFPYTDNPWTWARGAIIGILAGHMAFGNSYNRGYDAGRLDGLNLAAEIVKLKPGDRVVRRTSNER